MNREIASAPPTMTTTASRTAAHHQCRARSLVTTLPSCDRRELLVSEARSLVRLERRPETPPILHEIEVAFSEQAIQGP